MARLRPEARTVKQVNGHKLVVTRIGGRCYFSCDWPDIAREHDGCEDPCPAIDDFERRALSGTQLSLFPQEIVE